MRRLLLLDLFCGAGGCSEGYIRAGFDVVGVDIEPHPHYRGCFIQADALDYLAECGHKFDGIHASPPCQGYSVMKHFATKSTPMLVEAVREACRATDKLYVIENVVGAPLIEPLLLCGSMFHLQTSCGAQLRRHRLFESNVPLPLCPPGPCQHGPRFIGVAGHSYRNEKLRYAKRRTISVTGTSNAVGERTVMRETFPVSEAQRAMGIHWMPMKHLSQAIPPAYTEWIGRQLLRHFTL